MTMRTPLLAGMAFGLIAVAPCAHAADATGTWLTESKKAHVQLAPCGNKLCGKIVWLKEPTDQNGKPKVDKENPDAAKHETPSLGSVMIDGMAPDGPNSWNGGTIYNAEDGNTYASKMELTDPVTLKVSGCVLFFCKKQTWTRVN